MMGFISGFRKIAVDDLAETARVLALAPQQTYSSGTGARENMSTGQAKGRATRTFNVQNEDKQFASKFHRNFSNARYPNGDPASFPTESK